MIEMQLSEVLLCLAAAFGAGAVAAMAFMVVVEPRLPGSQEDVQRHSCCDDGCKTEAHP